MARQWADHPVNPQRRTKAHRIVRAQLVWKWRMAQAPCWRCGLPIRYDLSSPHPLSLVCGHRIGLAEGARRGISIDVLNSASKSSSRAPTLLESLGRNLGEQKPEAQAPASRYAPPIPRDPEAYARG
jgi:hypothetical protein